MKSKITDKQCLQAERTYPDVKILVYRELSDTPSLLAVFALSDNSPKREDGEKNKQTNKT